MNECASAPPMVAEKIETLARGDVPIYEPGLAELIQKNTDRLHWTLDMGEVYDLYLFDAAGTTVLASSTNPGNNFESLSWMNTTAGNVTGSPRSRRCAGRERPL